VTKPVKPTHVQKTNPGLGHAKQTTKPAAPPKAKGQSQRHQGGTGQGGQGNGKGGGQAQDPAADTSTHGKSGR
jgi:hypothetical protein